MENFGRYHLLKRLAVGGMAEIFLARSASIDGFEKDVVIKRIRPDLGDDVQFSSMFIDEARISISLTHPNIVQVFDFGKADDAYFLAMEYVHGCDLDAVLQLETVRKRGVDPGISLVILTELLKGLDYAHNKTNREGVPLEVVHRDISPANVLLAWEGAVKIADFGIARAAGAVAENKPGTVLGKLSYMSPEQAEGKDLDRRSDIFAAGVVLWELLLGKFLRKGEIGVEFFEAIKAPAIEPPSRHNPTLPKELDEIIARATATDSAARYSTAREFGKAVHDAWVRLYPDRDGYSLGAFLAQNRDELRDISGVEDFTDVPELQLTGPRPAATGTLILDKSKVIPQDLWSPELIEQIETFRRRPSLFRFIAMGDICLRQEQGEAALRFYRTAAVKFAQHGLLAQSLMCCRRMMRVKGFDLLAGEIAEMPRLQGRASAEVVKFCLLDDDPVSQLIAELLGDASPRAGARSQGTPLLSALDGRSFAELAQTVGVRTYKEGEHIVSQGEPGRTMFLIADGRVLVHAVGHDGRKVYLSSLTAGDFFGENSFFTGAPRSATVEALYPCEVFEIDQAAYDRAVQGNDQAASLLLSFYKERIVDTVMAKSGTFGLLAADERRALIERFELRSIAQDQSVFREGELSDEIFLIKGGRAEVFTEKGGPRTVLSEIGPGTIFGEVAALRRIPRTASVCAKTPLDLLVLPGAAFNDVLANKPDVRSKILEVIAQRARENMDKVMGSGPGGFFGRRPTGP